MKILYIDVAKMDRICYSYVIEGNRSLEELDLNQAIKANNMYNSFINCTDETDRQMNALTNQLKEPLPDTIEFFKV